jgi:hypothetical protein
MPASRHNQRIILLELERGHKARGYEPTGAISHGRPKIFVFYLAEQGVGFQPEASGSFLNCVLVTKGGLKYDGSSTMAVSMSHSSPLGAAMRSKVSVRTAFAL